MTIARRDAMGGTAAGTEGRTVDRTEAGAVIGAFFCFEDQDDGHTNTETSTETRSMANAVVVSVVAAVVKYVG